MLDFIKNVCLCIVGFFLFTLYVASMPPAPKEQPREEIIIEEKPPVDEHKQLFMEDCMSMVMNTEKDCNRLYAELTGKN